MNYAYSPSKNAFYYFGWKNEYDAAGTWPTDAIEVTDDIHEKYSADPPKGKILIAGADGMPAWGDIPPPTHEEIVTEASFEKHNRIDAANDYMNSKQWPGKAAMGRLKDAEKVQYNAWLDYLDALEAVNTLNAPDITWPEIPT
ncbi:tail fiber assembly protein [Enterobacter sp. N18-03635]|uniref:tail fiber assembly protein n=1 Tax=Enterobacter sp. N18-03635 TaxID=2500132 RepID=UPI000FDC4540|nr:tail fiber assembly protein [Enterobacter sp. N18-03635]AZV06815.1 tail fiber assembly protein [Enterobacter sp. N18-03635]